MLCQFLLYSKVTQLYIYIYIYININDKYLVLDKYIVSYIYIYIYTHTHVYVPFHIFPIMVCGRILNVVPYSRTLLFLRSYVIVCLC